MEGVPLKRRRPLETDFLRCIICQQITNCEVTSTENGRDRILQAANIRQDIVHERLLQGNTAHFVYHMNNDCYKKYTLKKTLDRISNKNISQGSTPGSTETTDDQSKRFSTRSKIKPRESPNPADIYSTACVICGQIKYKGVCEKFRIAESNRAEIFLKATVFYQDDVYTRTCDLQDIHSVFGADLLCHKNCIRSYIRRYEKDTECSDAQQEVPPKIKVFHELIASVDANLLKGVGYALSDIRDMANVLGSEVECTFSNREIRILLCHHYKGNLSISFPREANKSGMVFLKDTTSVEDMADTIRSIDPITACAKMIREALMTEDFHLKDKFCDANDLEKSWNNIVIPPVVLKFLGVLFQFDPNQFPQVDGLMADDVDVEDDDGQSSASHRIRRRMVALYQILYYNVHHGRYRTPLHIMNAQAIHEACKSSTLIKGFNRFGLTISYDELLRYHNDMASLIVQSAQGNVPLPSHFDAEMFTIGAFDNFDHEEATISGVGGSHDTVSVLFQDKPVSTKMKPNISDTNVIHGAKTLKHELPCQTLIDFVKPARKPDLPETFTVPDELYKMAKCKHDEIKKKDLAWSLSRLDVSKSDIGTNCDDQTMPSWAAFNSIVTDENISEKIVGFLPLLPSPVTEYATVYTALKNFQNVLEQLQQPKMAVTCDEGVYHIAREIMLQRPMEFSNLVLCIGSFHMIKILLGSIGKYLRGGGAETILTECGIFGLNVVEAVLNGSNYVRSMKGMYLLAEAMERLQFIEFFKQNPSQSYKEEIIMLQKLKDSVSTKNQPQSKECLKNFMMSSDKLHTDFEQFKKEKEKQSETFTYWNNFIQMVYMLKDLVRADREGNWELHLHTVQSILPLFAVCDRTNYLRWGAVYLEDMRKLPENAPEVHQAFVAGKFVVKRTRGQFKAVGADMCLEQTINRSQKSSSGIIGSSRKKHFVTQWEMIYHEMLAVSNLHRNVSGSRPFNFELIVSHEFNKAETDADEMKIKDILTYVQSHENPFTVEERKEKKLHNILTQEIMPDVVREQLLCLQDIGAEKYGTFRNERLINKTKRLSDTIHRTNLQTFNSIAKNVKKIPQKISIEKKSRNAQKILDIARVRGCDMKEVFQYDLLATNSLIDGDGYMTKPNKSSLTIELEKVLAAEDYIHPSQWDYTFPTAYIVDVMAYMRRIKTKNLKSFGELCEHLWNMIFNICKNPKRIDFVFDSYVEGSVKDSERSRRATARGIEISALNESSPLPVSMESFWASASNKTKLQKLFSEWLKTHHESNWPDVVISGMKGTNDLGAQHCQLIRDELVGDLPQLDIAIEEADVRLVPHAVQATITGNKRICVLSADTDVLVVALYHWKMLCQHGLVELWMRAGVGDSTRYIPLHTLAQKIGPLCDVLPAVHSLTGCDTTSKFGTKAGALKANPLSFLQGFGLNPNDPSIEVFMTNAEAYLVQVLKPGSSCKTMDELRYQMYHQSKAVTIDQLPPTSAATLQHVRRGFYAAHIQMNCLNGTSLCPLQYGFIEVDGLLMPDINIHMLPDDIAFTCSCQKCASKRCVCRQNLAPCCVFCKCQSDTSQCMNPN